jgi:hypothetical protein
MAELLPAMRHVLEMGTYIPALKPVVKVELQQPAEPAQQIQIANAEQIQEQTLQILSAALLPIMVLGVYILPKPPAIPHAKAELQQPAEHAQQIQIANAEQIQEQTLQILSAALLPIMVLGVYILPKPPAIQPAKAEAEQQ